MGSKAPLGIGIGTFHNRRYNSLRNTRPTLKRYHPEGYHYYSDYERTYTTKEKTPNGPETLVVRNTHCNLRLQTFFQHANRTLRTVSNIRSVDKGFMIESKYTIGQHCPAATIRASLGVLNNHLLQSRF